MEHLHLDRLRTPRSPRPIGLLGVLVVATAALIAAACSSNPRGTAGPDPEGDSLQPLDLTSAEFGEGERIPVRFTCDGDDISPPLAWSGVPEGTVSLALSMEDQDAPSGTFRHWAVAEIDPSTSSLDPAMLPIGAVQGVNDFGTVGYGGPCPPRGDDPHRYVFTVHALDREMNLESGFSADELRQALDGAEIARGRLIGVFSR